MTIRWPWPLKAASVIPRAGLVLLVSACAVVEVTTPEGTKVDSAFYPGVVVLRLEPGADAAVVAESSGAGVFARPGRVSVGAWQDTVAALPPDCRLVVWPRSGAELEHVLARLSEVPGSCVIRTSPGNRQAKAGGAS